MELQDKEITMRIRRARPKYLEAGMFDGGRDSVPIGTNREMLYFNRGSTALKFLLQCLAAEIGRCPVVCMQSFNCSTVLEAAVESGARIVLNDIKLSDCSLPLSFLEDNAKTIDVLLLLHYQGCRNEEHEEIAEFCSSNEITLIEDLAHCDDQSWKLLGDFGIYSYAFDKPFTCMYGGSLVFGNISPDICRRIRNRYAALPAESIQKQKRDLDLLRYLFKASDPVLYDFREAPHSFIVLMQRLRIADKTVHRVLASRRAYWFCRACSALFGRLKGLFSTVRYPVLRMGGAKVSLLERQRHQFAAESRKFRRIAKSTSDILRSKLGIDIDDRDIAWNRLSFFCPQVSARSALKVMRMEASNFNWPVALHSVAKFRRHTVSSNVCPNSEYACENIVNVPVWNEDVIEMIAMSQYCPGSETDLSNEASDCESARRARH